MDVASLAAGAFVTSFDRSERGWVATFNGMAKPYGADFLMLMGGNDQSSHLDVLLARPAMVDAFGYQPAAMPVYLPRRIDFAVSDTERGDDFRVVKSVTPAEAPPLPPSGIAAEVRVRLDAPVHARRLRITYVGNHDESKVANNHGLAQFHAYGRFDGPAPQRDISGVYSFPNGAVAPSGSGYLIVRQTGNSVEGCTVDAVRSGGKLVVKSVIGSLVGGLEDGVFRFVRTDAGQAVGTPGFIVVGPQGKDDTLAYAALLDKSAPQEEVGEKTDLTAVPCAANDKPPADPIDQELTQHGRMALYGINFDFDSAKLRGNSVPLLDKVAAWLKAHPDAKLEIEGHTDDSGTAAHNQTLSQGRADAAKAYLVGAGIAADRLTTAAFGATKPQAPNDSETHRAQNRRVEIVRR
ncbi:Peptidoglycan-associated lipoprotein [Ralstonia mannitolilytica]|uniref:OmpA family protein n=1 Tax=Ralstonia mannitolilytica TaxID=105219 RepID=UPI0007B09CBA|nr:OmpA family protein [Ralstonia mannitolilytica]CAJ0693991.1 Peptidoglycan-associated lipoprotein [Ralstonia mannitolilytica]CAJ0891017.1 Peptidoglycan-associated lipoprotein [Ralstonia mannitolilytica]